MHDTKTSPLYILPYLVTQRIIIMAAAGSFFIGNMVGYVLSLITDITIKRDCQGHCVLEEHVLRPLKIGLLRPP